MAGTILIGKKSGLAVSSIEFDYMIDRIRGAFMPGEENIRKQVFEPLDDGGMTFISAADIDAHSYHVFSRAIRRAHEKAMLEESFPKHQTAWLDLIRMTDHDPRCSANGSDHES
jgi:hypothetical protein